jgi:perosamine synthetase
MTDLQASIGRVQLKKLPTFIEKREKFFSMYQNFGLNLLDSSLKGFYPVRYRAVLLTNKQNEIISSLAKKKYSCDYSN